MSAPTSCKSSNTWGLKSYLKTAVSFALLSQACIAAACRPVTLVVEWEVDLTETCFRGVCGPMNVLGTFTSLTIPSTNYKKMVVSSGPRGKTNLHVYHCSPDGVFCVNVRGKNNVSLEYAGNTYEVGPPTYSKGDWSQGIAEYSRCLQI